MQWLVFLLLAWRCWTLLHPPDAKCCCVLVFFPKNAHNSSSPVREVHIASLLPTAISHKWIYILTRAQMSHRTFSNVWRRIFSKLLSYSYTDSWVKVITKGNSWTEVKYSNSTVTVTLYLSKFVGLLFLCHFRTELLIFKCRKFLGDCPLGPAELLPSYPGLWRNCFNLTERMPLVSFRLDATYCLSRSSLN